MQRGMNHSDDFNVVLKDLLQRWSHGDSAAHDQAFRLLQARLPAPRDVLRALSEAEVDEIRQDVLYKLLNAQLEAFCGATLPMAYARRSFRYRLVEVLRKWKPRQKLTPEDRDQIAHTFHDDAGLDVGQLVDAHIALSIAEKLDGKGRLAVLLTSAPNRISSEDWRSLAASHPPPPPRRPSFPLDADEASRLMYPPPSEESDAEIKRRRDTFDKLYRRAVRAIRDELEAPR